MTRRGFTHLVLILALAVPALAQENDDAVVHTGYVWSVATRGSGDSETDSTYFVLCRQEVRLPSNEQCQVVWLSGDAEVTVGEYARVSGVTAQVTQGEVLSLRKRFLLGESTEEEFVQLGEYFDVINCHQMIRTIAYGEPPSLLERFDVLTYVRAQKVARVEK